MMGDNPENQTNVDLGEALRSAAQELARQINDASELTVETKYIVLEESEEPTLVARTTIELDGDTEVVIPMRREASGALVRDEGLLEFHLGNVENAIAYRANLLDTILEVARTVRSR
jgi:hypothetical protein